MQFLIHLDMRNLELVVEQRERIGDYFIETDLRQFSAGCAGEIKQIVHNLRRAECLLCNSVKHPSFRRIRLQLLCQHLRVRRDDRQWRIHFVRHARGQQSNR